jgi:hypothetical protein
VSKETLLGVNENIPEQHRVVGFDTLTDSRDPRTTSALTGAHKALNKLGLPRRKQACAATGIYVAIQPYGNGSLKEFYFVD